MPDRASSESTEALAILRRLEGTIFAGGIGRLRASADCSCQNCGCDSRAGDSCACNPRCSCEGHTNDRIDMALDPILGIASVLPLEDVRSLVELRDKLRAAVQLRR